MLRRIEGMGALGLRRMDWDGAAALTRKALVWTALAGAMFLLCRVQAERLAPFAMAFLAAALLAGHNAAALLAGCLAGAMNGSLRDFNLRLPVGAAIVLGGSIAWELARPALQRALRGDTRLGAVARLVGGWLTGRERGDGACPAPNRLARSPNGAGAVGSALAGAGVLLPGLALMGEALTVPASVGVTAASVAAVAAAPFFQAALEAGSRRRLSQERRIGLWLMLCLGCAGLATLSTPVGLCVGGALAALLYPSGALAGVGLGMAALAVTGEPRLLAVLAVGGATAQLCAGASRASRGLCAGGAMLAAGVLLNLPPVCLAGAAASALAALPMPEAWTRFFLLLSRPALPEGDPRRQAMLSRRRAAGRLNDLAAAFGELAEGYREPVALPDEQALIQRLREKLCAGCGDYGACWAGERHRGARFLCDLIAQAVLLPEDAPLFEGEATPELLRRCRRGRLVPERAEALLEDFARARREALRRDGVNALASEQFAQARQLLAALAGSLVRPPRPARPRLRVERGAACASREAGVPSGDSHLVCQLDEGRLLALISDGMGSGPDAARESAQAARLLGRFLRAGAPCDLALETVNALLLNRGGEDMFATADVLLLDLSTGEAEFMKQAACPTLIVRRGEAHWLEGGRLPLGILERVSAEPSRARLLPGDVVLLASDGVLDAAGSALLEALLLDGAAAGDDMTRLSERVLDAAGAACEGGRRDDMTAICLRVESGE